MREPAPNRALGNATWAALMQELQGIELRPAEIARGVKLFPRIRHADGSFTVIDERPLEYTAHEFPEPSIARGEG